MSEDEETVDLPYVAPRDSEQRIGGKGRGITVADGQRDVEVFVEGEMCGASEYLVEILDTIGYDDVNFESKELLAEMMAREITLNKTTAVKTRIRSGEARDVADLLGGYANTVDLRDPYEDVEVVNYE